MAHRAAGATMGGGRLGLGVHDAGGSKGGRVGGRKWGVLERLLCRKAPQVGTCLHTLSDNGGCAGGGAVVASRHAVTWVTLPAKREPCMLPRNYFYTRTTFSLHIIGMCCCMPHHQHLCPATHPNKQEVFSGEPLRAVEQLRRTDVIPPALLADYQKLLSSQVGRRLNPAKVCGWGLVCATMVYQSCNGA